MVQNVSEQTRIPRSGFSIVIYSLPIERFPCRGLTNSPYRLLNYVSVVEQANFRRFGKISICVIMNKPSDE